MFGLMRKLRARAVRLKTKGEYGYKSPKVNLGQIQSHINLSKQTISSINEVEFQVFSQFGDDGIIQWLINKIDIPNKTFVEFGVENYTESNTRFLLINNKWKGLVIDGSEANIDYINKYDPITGFFDLQAVTAFITKDNINELISRAKFEHEIGLLSIDIDGNDYWVWKEIAVVNPVIVICEYNALFGPSNSWTMPYKNDFVIGTTKPWNYWGASLQAFCDLAEQKGYSFIGCNLQGNNSYFIRNDKLGDIKKVLPTEGFRQAQFTLVRKNGAYESLQNKNDSIKGLEIFNVRTGQIEYIQ
jgi:hypothetical protein